MRLEINLATQPYEQVRRFYTQWGTGVALVLVLTGVMVYAATSGYLSARSHSGHLRDVQAQIAKLDKERTQAEQFLNRPENRDVRDKSRMLNRLIERKALSWTQVFSDLEKLMPPRLHMVSIQPVAKSEDQVSTDKQVELRMLVAGDSRDRAVELVKRMEDSPRFRQPQVRAEATRQASGSPDTVEFEISAVYVPRPERGAR